MKNIIEFIKSEYNQMVKFRKEIDKIGLISNKLGKLKYCIDFDNCTWKYHIDLEEYFIFEFYNKTKCARNCYISDIDSAHTIPLQFNSDKSAEILFDKSIFNKTFSSFVGREWMVLIKDNIDDFILFCKDKECIIVKPLDSDCGKGIKKLTSCRVI